MVLDIDLFRVDKGGNPEIIFKNERDRFKDTKRVELVLEADENWRKCKFFLRIILVRFRGDAFNKLKNLCSKIISKQIKV